MYKINDITNKILCGDALEELKKFPENSVDCTITSPPYWGLRDYNTATWEGGDNSNCDHIEVLNLQRDCSGGFSGKDLGTKGNQGFSSTSTRTYKDICKKCGAKKIDQQFGMESNFNNYVDKLCNIFDEVYRILKKDGSLWVNLGDSYSTISGNMQSDKHLQPKYQSAKKSMSFLQPDSGLPSKCLCMIPQRFAIEMISNRGWVLRNTIIWHKNNSLPSPAKDRFSVNFEYLFFFVKQQKYYFNQQFEKQGHWGKRNRDNNKYKNAGLACGLDGNENPNGRNMRTIWTINTTNFAGNHFATFPEKLVETPLNASCPEFICTKCGKARKLIVDSSERLNTRPGKNMGNGKSGKDNDPNKEFHTSDLSKYKQKIIYKNNGYTNCECDSEFKAGIVLDPFVGTGTVPVVAYKQNKNYIGIDLNEEYVEIAEKRINYVKTHPEDFIQKNNKISLEVKEHTKKGL